MIALNRSVWVAVVLALFGCAPAPTAATIPPPALAGARRPNGPTFRAFTVGRTPGLPVTAVPRDVVAGPNGSVWFTDLNTPAIGSISSNLKFHEFTTGLNAGAEPYSLVMGPDGNIWFSDGAGAVGRATPSGTITEFGSPRMAAASPGGIAVGADNAIWAIGVGTSRSYLFRVTLTGRISQYRIPKAFIPDGALEADSKGNLWFFGSLADHKVYLAQRRSDGTIALHATGLVTKGEPCCPNVSPKHVAIGPDQHPWFTTPYFALPTTDGPHVGTFGEHGTTLFAVNRNAVPYLVYPSGIVSSSHNLWFSGSNPLSFDGALWRMDTAGKQIGYPIPYDPAGLTAVNDTTLWFTSQVQGRPPQLVEATF